MANFFSTAIGKAITGVASKVVGGYTGQIGSAIVEGGAAYAEARSLEKGAKKAAKKAAKLARKGGTVSRGVSLPVMAKVPLLAQKTLAQAKASGFVRPATRAMVPPIPSRAMWMALSPNSLMGVLGGGVLPPPVPQVPKGPPGFNWIDLVQKGVEIIAGKPGGTSIWDMRPQTRVEAPVKKVTTRYDVLQSPYGGGFSNGGATGSFNGKAPVNRLTNGYMWQGPMQGTRSRRTMNPANIKALRRAARRLESFVKIAKRFIRIEKTVKIKKSRSRR